MIIRKARELYHLLLTDDAVRKIAVYAVFGLLPIVSGFLLTPFYTRTLSQDEYGKLSYLNVLQSYFMLAVFLGIDNSLTRYYFEFRQNKDKLKTMFATSFQFIIFLSVLSGVVCYFLIEVFHVLSGLKDYLLVLFNVLFTALVTVFLNFYRDDQVLKKFIFVSVVQFIGVSAGSIGGILFISKTADGCYAGRALCLGLSSIIIFVPNISYILRKPDNQVLSMMFRFGISFIPYSLIGTIYESLDRMIIEERYAYKALGTYNIAFVIAFLINVLVNSLMQTYNPKIYTYLQERKGTEDLARLRKRMLLFACLATFLLSATCYPLILVFAGPLYLKAIPYVPILSIFFLLRFYFVIYSVPLFFYKKTFLLPVVITGSLLSFLLFFYIGGRHFAIVGIIASLILSRVVQVLITRWVSKNLIPPGTDVYSGMNHALTILTSLLCILLSITYLYIT